jgi:hypothetical protein
MLIFQSQANDIVHDRFVLTLRAQSGQVAVLSNERVDHQYDREAEESVPEHASPMAALLDSCSGPAPAGRRLNGVRLWLGRADHQR